MTKSSYFLSAFFSLFAALSAQAADQDRSAGETQRAEQQSMTVYHDPNCGCCSKWIEHMRDHGFNVESVLARDMGARKQKLGIPPRLRSCHTAVVDGYVIEGHVPARDLQRLLEERPQARGLSVPGMPVGSPGMEYNGVRHPYDVLVFDEGGSSSVFTHYPARN